MATLPGYFLNAEVMATLPGYFTSSFGILSFGASGLLNGSRGRLAHWAPREVGLLILPPWILIHGLG